MQAHSNEWSAMLQPPGVFTWPMEYSMTPTWTNLSIFCIAENSTMLQVASPSKLWSSCTSSLTAMASHLAQFWTCWPIPKLVYHLRHDGHWWFLDCWHCLGAIADVAKVDMSLGPNHHQPLPALPKWQPGIQAPDLIHENKRMRAQVQELTQELKDTWGFQQGEKQTQACDQSL